MESGVEAEARVEAGVGVEAGVEVGVEGAVRFRVVMQTQTAMITSLRRRQLAVRPSANEAQSRQGMRPPPQSPVGDREEHDQVIPASVPAPAAPVPLGCNDEARCLGHGLVL